MVVLLEELRSALAVVGMLASLRRNVVALADDGRIVTDVFEIVFDSFAEIFAADLKFLVDLNIG